MGLSRSTYYDVPSLPTDDAALVATMRAICDEFEAYGYRRVGPELRHRGIVVNSKKIRRLMRENDLQPKRRKRFVATTDSDHDGPIFPDLARDRILDGPNQVWVADITYIAIAIGFVYMAAILDAWSRRVVGYAISRSIDARLGITPRRSPRRPPPSSRQASPQPVTGASPGQPDDRPGGHRRGHSRLCGLAGVLICPRAGLAGPGHHRRRHRRDRLDRLVAGGPPLCPVGRGPRRGPGRRIAGAGRRLSQPGGSQRKRL